MSAVLPLVERKRRQARERIIAAADELFDVRGFDKVSVSDIADLAEVGRTTFFRHFGDKQEVVFARQQELLETIASVGIDGAPSSPRTVEDGVRALRPLVLELCARFSADPEAYERHHRLLEQHDELRARDALKQQQIADRFSDLLVERGCDGVAARLAAEVALACYRSADRLHGDPRALERVVAGAFEQVLSLGAGARDS